MSRRNPFGSTAKKRRQTARSRAASRRRVYYTASVFWEAVTTFGSNVGPPLDAAIKRHLTARATGMVDDKSAPCEGRAGLGSEG